MIVLPVNQEEPVLLVPCLAVCAKLENFHTEEMLQCVLNVVQRHENTLTRRDRISARRATLIRAP